MTSIRQTKKDGKKFVAEGLILDEWRKRHYSRVYKRFHKAMQKQLSDMSSYDFLSCMADKVGPILELSRKEILNGSRWLSSNND